MKQLFVALLLFSSITLVGQDIPPPPADKAVIYFARPSSFGFAINFSYFDSTQLVGRFNGAKYIRYECRPGKHLFWARSENRDFVEADVEAGKIYLIEAVVQMGAMKAAVQLVPTPPQNTKRTEAILKLFKKKPSESFTPAQLAADTKDLGDVISRGLEKYRSDKASGITFRKLDKTMFYIQ